jgi:hypothetical protein
LTCCRWTYLVAPLQSPVAAVVSQVSYNNFPFPLELIRSSVEEKATGSWHRCRSMSPACGGRTWGGCVTLAGGHVVRWPKVNNATTMMGLSSGPVTPIFIFLSESVAQSLHRPTIVGWSAQQCSAVGRVIHCCNPLGGQRGIPKR